MHTVSIFPILAILYVILNPPAPPVHTPTTKLGTVHTLPLVPFFHNLTLLDL